MVKDGDKVKYYKKIKKNKPKDTLDVIKQSSNKNSNFNPNDVSFKQNTKVIWEKLLNSNEKVGA